MTKSQPDPANSQFQALKQLKKQLQQSKSTTKQEHPVASESETAEEIDDSALFLQAVKGVKKLSAENHARIKQPAKRLDAQTLAKRAAASGSSESASDSELSDIKAMLNPVASQERLSYRIGTLQHRVFERLKKGDLRWYEAVDLHGCNIEQARQAVLDIVQITQNNQETVCKIVHGKGPDAILKTHVNGWLRQHAQVLAFCSAPENQGGTGAVLVLLKQQAKNNK